MAKQKFKITNWPAYNKALRQRGSLTVWLDESAIAAWTDSAQPEGRGRPLHYTDMAITTVLMMKRVFTLSLRALQGFVDSIFQLMGVALICPDYSLVSKRAKTVNIRIKTPTRGEIEHLVIDSTGLKVFGEGEWKVRQHGADKRRVWRKLHLAADSVTHEIICADLSLSGTTDAQALPALIGQTHRKIKQASADGAYDVCYCHDALIKKKIRPLIPPRSGAQYWPDKYHERNHAVANQHLSGSNGVWKKKVGYHRRSVAETAMFRIKTLPGGHLSLRDYDAQVGEAMAMVKALNRMTLLGMPDSIRIA
ncbi:IS5 family transposase [Salmonella enterica]|nr:IS5 family transposase [Salmonella enterica]EKK6346772.1 IS5 family transposase [Salmonella enterica]ELO7822469.1 IS5 family transposase [Salmonella enterica]ELR6878813.1 IS5 family transposase [Salmonella enterica]